MLDLQRLANFTRETPSQFPGSRQARDRLTDAYDGLISLSVDTRRERNTRAMSLSGSRLPSAGLSWLTYK